MKSAYLYVLKFRKSVFSSCVLIITEIHELKKVIGDAAADAFIENPTEENLKACFSAMMNASKDTIASALSELLQRFPGMGKYHWLLF